MHKTIASSLVFAVLAIAAAGPASGQGADNYPNKPIRFIVPFTPGGPNDILARLVGQKLSERWSQQVAVDNRGGANGIIGADAAAKSPADGYTLFLGNAGVLTTNPALYSKLPYDAERDFAPVNLMATAPFLLVVQPKLGAKSLPELIKLAKSRDGQLNFGSGGVGATAHLAGELLNFMAGIKTQHVAYKGAAPALADLLGGRLTFTFTSTVEALPHLKSGQLLALGITSPQRSTALPDVPAIAETLSGYEVRPWYGVLVPAKTPRPIVDKLYREVSTVLQAPEVVKQLTTGGAEVVSLAPEEFSKTITREIAMWKKLAREANLKLEQ